MNNNRYDRPRTEEGFHDKWAMDTNVASIDVYKRNESITAPEMRYIKQTMGSLNGKKLLDVGCGLGEASVYFAINGADVTSVDISEGMLQVVDRLAARYRVRVRTGKFDIEKLSFEDKFDIVYAGNLFHHIDIEPAIKRFASLLKYNGSLISWDPLSYNPIINMYRFIAKKVRTSDEHPLKARDIALFKKYFSNVKIKYFWLSSLMIFVCMAVVERRDPNKERFWKAVVDEGDKWAWLYKPLEAIDGLILKLFPFLGLLCWNIVVIASNNRDDGAL
jgi:SAM-dependent methyltransferase